MSRPPPRGSRVRALLTRGLAFTPYSDSAKYSLLRGCLVACGPGDVQPPIASAAPSAIARADLLRPGRHRNAMLTVEPSTKSLITPPLHEHRRRFADPKDRGAPSPRRSGCDSCA